jgi:uncharacterized membrane protein
MTQRRVLHVFAAAATLVVIGLVPSVAFAHPEECANTGGAFSGSPTGSPAGRPTTRGA